MPALPARLPPLWAPALAVALGAAWLAAFGPSLRWLAQSLLLGHGGVHLALAALVLLFAALHILTWPSAASPPPADPSPLLRLRPGPLLAALLCAVLAAVVQHGHISHTLGAGLLVLGSYALAGLLLPRRRWRRGVPLLLLVLCLLPFQQHLDAFVGFPLRVATAQIVHRELALLHIASTPTDTILMLDSGLAHVDLPCSGVRGLWTGALFFLCATWLHGTRLGLRWALCGVALAAAILAANTMRVLILVLCALCAGRPDLAQVLHLPLGAIGFLAALVLGLALLWRCPPAATAAAAAQEQRTLPMVALMPAIALLVGLAVFSHRAPPPWQPAAAPAPLAVPGWALTPVPLTAGEAELFTDHAPLGFGKWRFTVLQGEAAGSGGALLLSVSRSARSHHPPELCLAASGQHIDHLRAVAITPTTVTVPQAALPAASPSFPARELLLGDGRPGYYWFQSRDRTTADLLSRTLAQVSLDPATRSAPWALVGVVLDQPQSARRTAALLTALHQAAATQVQGEPR